MSFFDPANMFGGGGSRVRDPLGLFGGGRRQMSPQEIAQAQGGGGQSQRGNAFGGGFGGASGYRGQGMRESDFGGPAEMQMPAPQPGGQFGQMRQQMQSRLGGDGVNPGPQWGQMAGDLSALGGGPQFGGFSGGKPAPMQGGPNPAAMMQSQAPQQWGQLASALASQGGKSPGMQSGIDAWRAKGPRFGRGPRG